MTLVQYEEVAPDPSAMIESLRAYGYTLSTAIADLIDNSIAAHASTVWIQMRWDGADSWISIADDGNGMDEVTLRDAMRLGSTSPLLQRDEDDLGRFGLGLKTASLSQCRRLTVRSRPDGNSDWTRRWDLDHLANPDTTGWHLLMSCADGSQERLSLPVDAQSGTVVLWEQLDRLVGDAEPDDERMKEHWFELAAELEEHLSMVFHRFLEARANDGRLKILINGREISPWNPFYQAHPATEKVGEQSLQRLSGVDGTVHFTGFVLPHKDKLGDQLHRDLRGPKGWNAQQGFYLYRNRRLIVSGSWLGLESWTQEEHYKLARIQLDIPNSMDHLWQLDVKKSSASPPPRLRKELTGLAQSVRRRAREVFAFRAKYGPRAQRRQETDRPWKSVKMAGGRTYRIDRQHELIRAVAKKVKQTAGREFETALRILEETVPVEQIWLDKAEHPEDFNQPFYGTGGSELRDIIETFYRLLRRNRAKSHEDAIAILGNSQEFTSDEAQSIIGTLEEE